MQMLRIAWFYVSPFLLSTRLLNATQIRPHPPLPVVVIVVPIDQGCFPRRVETNQINQGAYSAPAYSS